MTRETKVGIVVATSFLGLIGAVLAVKYLDPAERKNSGVAQTKPDAGANPAAGDPNKAPDTPAPAVPAAPALLPPMAAAPADQAVPVVIVPLTPATPNPDSTPLVSAPDGALDIFAHFNQTKAARGLLG